MSSPVQAAGTGPEVYQVVLGFPHHIDLSVTEMEKSVAFYDMVLGELGFRRTSNYGGGAPCWAHLGASATNFSIALKEARTLTPHSRYSPGLHHLAFGADSREAVDSFYGFLRNNNIVVLDPPAEYDYTPGYYAVFFSDPDDIKLEVVHEPLPELPASELAE